MHAGRSVLTRQTGNIICQDIKVATRRRSGLEDRGGKGGGKEKSEADPTEQGLHDERRETKGMTGRRNGATRIHRRRLNHFISSMIAY